MVHLDPLNTFPVISFVVGLRLKVVRSGGMGTEGVGRGSWGFSVGGGVTEPTEPRGTEGLITGDVCEWYHQFVVMTFRLSDPDLDLDLTVGITNDRQTGSSLKKKNLDILPHLYPDWVVPEPS